MKPISQQPSLGEQVYQALLDEICSGALAPGVHLVQEQLATNLGVSRQPVQQALAMLKNEGLVHEQGGRGLVVAPLDLAGMKHHYEIRAALDGLAARRAAEQASENGAPALELERAGAHLIAAGRKAVATGDIAGMVGCDVAFHTFVYEASGNPLIGPTAALHWRQMRRVMGEVLRRAGPASAIWRQHAAILDAIVAGDPGRAEAEAVEHVRNAARRLETALSAPNAAPPDMPEPKRKVASRSR